MIVGGVTDRSEQNSICSIERLDRFIRKRGARFADRASADQRLSRLDLYGINYCDRSQYAQCLFGYFRPDAVAGQYCYFH